MPQAEHTGLGIASLILGIIAIITSVIPIFILGILAVVFGAVSYWGESKDSYGLAGFILGLISVILNVVFWVVAFSVLPWMHDMMHHHMF
jgi:hypothetical protein